MSVTSVSMCRLVCDTCGASRDALTIGATSARLQAAAEGWKFIEYDLKGKGLQKRTRKPNGLGFTVDAAPRQWDSCPDCPLPTVEEAIAIMRQEATR